MILFLEFIHIKSFCFIVNCIECNYINVICKDVFLDLSFSFYTFGWLVWMFGWIFTSKCQSNKCICMLDVYFQLALKSNLMFFFSHSLAVYWHWNFKIFFAYIKSLWFFTFCFDFCWIIIEIEKARQRKILSGKHSNIWERDKGKSQASMRNPISSPFCNYTQL